MPSTRVPFDVAPQPTVVSASFAIVPSPPVSPALPSASQPEFYHSSAATESTTVDFTCLRVRQDSSFTSLNFTRRDCWHPSWLPTALAGKLMQLVASVRPSVRPTVCPFVLTLSFKPTDLWIWVFVCLCVMTIARLGLKVKIISQGQRSTRQVLPRSLIDGSFSSVSFVGISGQERI